jgi:hypothetical protein
VWIIQQIAVMQDPFVIRVSCSTQSIDIKSEKQVPVPYP